LLFIEKKRASERGREGERERVCVRERERERDIHTHTAIMRIHGRNRRL